MLIAAACGLGLGEAAFGLSLQAPSFLWPESSHAAFWAGGAALGAGFVLFQSGLGSLAWGLPALSGLRAGGAALLPCLAGFAWRLFARPLLPAPHDSALRSLQIFMAALAILPAFLALAAMLLRLGLTRGFAALPPRRLALRLAGCLWIFYLLTGAWGWGWRHTGDQPHYLLMSQSLSADGDLDLANNYASGQWRAFYDRGVLEPQYPAQGAKVFTEHKPLLPLLAAPLFGALGPYAGLWVASLIMAATAGLVAWLLLKAGLGLPAALSAFALFALNAASWTHAAAFYPDGLSGLLMLTACAALAGQLPRSWGLLAVMAMPWANARCYPAAAALMALALWQDRRSAAWLGLAALSFAAAFALNRAQFGSGDPMAAYHSVHRGLADMFPWREIPRQALGQWLDQEYGLLFWAPALAFGLAGVAAWKKFPGFGKAAYGLPLLAYYSVVAAYYDWTGVMAPCRYLVPLLPFLALSAAFALERMRGKLWFQFLLALTLAQGLAVAVLPWLNFSKMDGQNMALKALGARLGLNLTALFPSFMMVSSSSAAWALILAGFLALAWGNFRRDTPA
jgi:hypothetical protein